MSSSNTSSNIGNAFFYLGVRHLLGSLVPNARVYESQFLPINPYRLNRQQAANAFDYFAEVEGADAVVIAGPVLDRGFGRQFEPALARAAEADVPVLLLTAGGRGYDDEEVAHCRAVLERYRPAVFTSRDRDTFDAYADLAHRSYDGVCTSFFVDEWFEGYPTPKLEPYLVSTFDFGPEPRLDGVTRDALRQRKPIEVPTEARRTRAMANNVRYLLQRDLPRTVNGMTVVRATHRPLRSKHLQFHRPNLVSAFHHDSYLNLYRHAELTLTDRMHAAAVTLAFGRPALLTLASNRTRLLARAGFAAVQGEVLYPDPTRIREEKAAMRTWLATALPEALST
ncbi:MAG: polysaccharide pyruvyl transferase family protein [Trueperaceae bacterium]